MQIFGRLSMPSSWGREEGKKPFSKWEVRCCENRSVSKLLYFRNINKSYKWLLLTNGTRRELHTVKVSRRFAFSEIFWGEMGCCLTCLLAVEMSRWKLCHLCSVDLHTRCVLWSRGTLISLLYVHTSSKTCRGPQCVCSSYVLLSLFNGGRQESWVDLQTTYCLSG